METRLVELVAMNIPAWELVLRGTAIYWFLFLMFRFVVRREVGTVGIADLLVLVLIAGASQNALAGGYTTIAEGIVLVGTIIAWNLLFDWLAYRSRWFATFAEPAALALIRNGRILHRNLRREFVTVEELMSKLRTRGVDDVARVKWAFMEGNGEISVILAYPVGREQPKNSGKAVT